MQTAMWRWNNQNESWYQQTACILDILHHVIPPETDNSIGILGSAALMLYQEKYKIGPKWSEPKDYDVFVAGKYGKTQRVFFSFMNSVLDNMKGLAADEIVLSRKYRTYIRSTGMKVWIVEYKLAGISSKLSFIQSPHCKDLKEVAGKFDIDVCKVICHIHSQRLECDADIADHIRHHQAATAGAMFVNGRKGIQKDDIKAVANTMKRMMKYQTRGFKMINSGGILYLTKQEATEELN